MSTRKEKVQFTLSRLARFFKIFLKNKRGLVGLALVMFFVVMALGASVLTPYNQLGYPGNDARPVAGPEAEPGWVRFLPTALGGNPDLSENMFPMKNGDFTAESPLWPAGDWNLTISPTSDASAVTVQKITELGVDKMETSFLRAGSDSKGKVTILFSDGFYFPYTGTPAAVTLTWTLKLSGTMHEEDRKVWNGTTDTYDIVPVNVTDVPSKISMTIIDPSGRGTVISPLNAGGIFNQTGFATGFDQEQSFNEAVDARSLFTEKGDYAVGLTIQLYDTYNATRDVEYVLKVSNIDLRLLGTSWGILGTNIYGWDLWSQLVYGSRISLYVGLLAAVLGVSIGLVYGLAAGYSGRYVDEILMRISDVLLVLPGLPLLIVLFAVLGAKLENLIILNGLLGWMGFAKLVRSQVLSIRERPYIEAAKASGAGSMHILFRHVLPNVVSLVYVTFATSVPGAIVAEAALSWLGFIDYWRMSWGRMLEEMQAANAVNKWWWVVPPGLCIAAISIAFVLLGYALDEVLNPKLRMRK